MQYAKAKANKQEQKIIDLQEKILQIKDANCHSGPSSSIACNSSLETKQTEQQSTQKYIFFHLCMTQSIGSEKRVLPAQSFPHH